MVLGWGKVLAAAFSEPLKTFSWPELPVFLPHEMRCCGWKFPAGYLTRELLWLFWGWKELLKRATVLGFRFGRLGSKFWLCPWPSCVTFPHITLLRNSGSLPIKWDCENSLKGFLCRWNAIMRLEPWALLKPLICVADKNKSLMLHREKRKPDREERPCLHYFPSFPHQ